MFYLQYAARNLWRNRRWSIFAVLSIAAGVATIVALRSLGLGIADSLTDNLRASNHGDFTIEILGSGNMFGGVMNVTDDAVEFSSFTPDHLQAVEDWAAERGGTLSAYRRNMGIQLTRIDGTTAGRPQFVTLILIDPATYPPTQDIRSLDPPNTPLNALFQGGNEVVVSRNLAETNNIAVGDSVRISGSEEEFIVRGIVPTEVDAGLDNLMAAFFGFAYVDRASADKFGLSADPSIISIALPPESAPQNADESNAMSDQLRSLVRNDAQSYGVNIKTVERLLRTNQLIADYVGQFVVIMGLGAMLIGGVGIVNTMLVMVRRRTNEIAALKTFGLKGRQVAALFMAEAFLLGGIGSIVGSVFGVLLSGLANAYGETLIQQPLVWRVYPEALLFGAVLGMVISLVFGIIPVLTAVKVRPGIILRPNETHIPSAGIFQSILALLFVVLTIGLIAGQILGNYLIGIIGVTVVMIILGILILLLWVVVWLVGFLPAFGNPDLRLAIRNLRARRLRTATTLLALSAGMFALSSVAFLGAGFREIVQVTFSNALGGNVIVMPLLPGGIANPLIDNTLAQAEGVTGQLRYEVITAQLAEVDGVAFDVDGFAEQREAIYAEMDAIFATNGPPDFERLMELTTQLDSIPSYVLEVAAQDWKGAPPPPISVTEGRGGFEAGEEGKNVLIVGPDTNLHQSGVKVGSEIVLEVSGRRYPFEVIGMNNADAMEMSLSQMMNFGDVIVPGGSISSSNQNLLGGITPLGMTIVNVENAHLNDVLLDLSALPLTFSLDISFIDGLLRRFIDQFSAMPVLVGLLSLGAAAVIMANTVALATLERRQQIGILKAIGLKGWRVLWVMLLENVFISLLGAVIGLGLSGLGMLVMSYFGIDAAILIPSDAQFWAVLLVLGAVLIGAGATFLSAQVAIRERALNVLRYE
jgi:putative ABC transport system permease protein